MFHYGCKLKKTAGIPPEEILPEGFLVYDGKEKTLVLKWKVGLPTVYNQIGGGHLNLLPYRHFRLWRILHLFEASGRNAKFLPESAVKG